MGTLNKASCPCGFSRLLSIGGNQTSYMETSYFPFYCKEHGLISVNYRKSIECDRCKSEEIVPYGQEPVSIKTDDKWPTIQSFDYKAYETGNLCPKCKKYSLSFSSPDVWFD